MRQRDAAGLLALISYLCFSLFLIDPSLWAHFGSLKLGNGSDATWYMWQLVWWPYAISRGINPFVSYLVWVPAGVNLGWTCACPLAAILMWPVTLAGGPVAAFNIFNFVTPAVSAWGAFLLCRYLSHSWWGAGWAVISLGFHRTYYSSGAAAIRTLHS